MKDRKTSQVFCDLILYNGNNIYRRRIGFVDMYDISGKRVICIVLILMIMLQGVLYGDFIKIQSEYGYLNSCDKPYKLGDKYCGIYALWYALKYYNIQRSISRLEEEIMVDEKGGSSLSNIAEYLDKCGLNNEVVRLDSHKLYKVNQPFIPFLSYSGLRGHFVFCVPDGHGNAYELNGVRQPQLIDLKLLSTIDYDSWDGTVILLRPDRSNSVVLIIAKIIVFIAGLMLCFTVILKLLGSFSSNLWKQGKSYKRNLKIIRHERR